MSSPSSRPRRVLFVCTANQHRSRTAEELFGDNPELEVRSAGTDVHAHEPEEESLTAGLVEWADVIFVMEPYHRQVIEQRFAPSAPVVVLDIEDRFLRGDPELAKLLEERVSPHLR